MFFIQAKTFYETLSLVGIGAIITGLLAWWRFRPKDIAENRKTDADTAETLVKMATDLAQRASDQCAATSKELIETQKELDEAMRINEEQRLVILEHQKKLEIQKREHRDCMDEVKKLQQRIQDLTAPDRRRHNPNTD